MRILLAAKHTTAGSLPFGGVQSWISTVQRRLKRLGCDVSVWGPRDPYPQSRFDFGIIANYRYTSAISDYCESVLNVSHGVVKEEQPNRLVKNAFTSEEVRGYWAGDGVIVRQPINLDFWNPTGAPKRNALVFYSYRAPLPGAIEPAAKILGLEFRWIKNVNPEVAREEFRSASLVCASGRAALEAMACGAATLICDWRPYNGSLLMCADLNIAMQHNYSGRGGSSPKPEEIASAGAAAMDSGDMIDHVAKRHDCKAITEELLALC